MATTKKAAPKPKPKAKPIAQAEARVADSATKMIDESMEQMTDFAGKFGGFAEDGFKAFAEQAATSSEVFKTLGARNMDFFSRTLEQGVEISQSLTSAKDPREAMEIQSGFAKNLFSAYKSEVTAQADICMSAWRDAAKPFMAFAPK